MSANKPDHSVWSFRSILDTLVPTVHLTTCEIYIVWVLGEEGPVSIYNLGKKSRTMPEISSSFGNYGWESYPGEKKRYDYRVIYSKAKTLMEKNLVEHFSENREEHKLKLTFLGLLFYLQNLKASKESRQPRSKHVSSDDYLKILSSRYSAIPVFSNWKTIVKKLKPKKTCRALEDTVRNFTVVRAHFKVRPLGLEFKGFLKASDPLKTLASGYKKDGKVSELLKDREAIMLRDSHIAYLAVDSIKSIAGKNLDQISIFTNLESEIELAYFENRQIDSSPLFRGKRLLEFFPKYAGIEYFFTGMFVENLLWSKKPVRKAKEETKPPDFEVEFY